MRRVFVAVGSNIEPEANVTGALALLEAAVGVRAISTFYRTPAMKRTEDPTFVNGVVEVGEALGAVELKRLLRSTESALGRERVADRYAPRTIDLDLILYGGLVCASNELTLPDPEIRERPFLAIPLLELAPELVLPDCDVALRS